MKHFINYAIAAVTGFVCLVSCSEQESDLLSDNQSSNNQLRIVTHTREGEGTSTLVASVYLFNGSNEYVRTIQTDANSYTSASASVKLQAGSYTLIGINASPLTSFQFPESPTLTSAITQASGQPMGDLLIATGSATLSDGDTRTVDLSLERKVLEISSITISQVPDGVTGVAVSVAPFYSAIKFNGDFVEIDPTTCSFTLTESSTAGVWQATPQQLAFPSKGVPTITVIFTHADETTSTYTYTAEAALSANNKYNIAGTYTEPLGVTLSGTITFQSWATDPTAVNFDFDEHNAASNTNPDSGSGSGSGSGGSQTSDVPIVGQQYQGCYVISVTSNPNTAVLISPTEKNNYRVGNGGNWDDVFSNALSTWEADGSTVSGSWRMPTLEEFEDLAAYPEVLGLGFGDSKHYYCFADSSVKVVKIKRLSDIAGGIIEVELTTTDYIPAVYLRPVIDITY